MSEQQPDRFTDYSAEVVHEPARGLYWTKDDVGDGDLNYDEALAAVAKLNEQAFGGFTDWRMPTVEELFLLADRSRFNPAIDTNAFPTCKSEWYWSSTLYAEDPSEFAWIVYFLSGGSTFVHRYYSLRVRPVRGPARE